MSGEVEIVSADGGSTFMWVRDGTLTSRWTPGSYAVVAAADVEGLHGAHSLGLAMLTAPEVDLTTNRVVVLDAAKARQVKVATPQPTAVTNSRIDVYRSFTSEEPTPSDTSALAGDVLARHRLRQPVGSADKGQGEEGQLRPHHPDPGRADATGDHPRRPPRRRPPRAARAPADARRHVAPGRRLRRHRHEGRLRRPVRPWQGGGRTRQRRRDPHRPGGGGAWPPAPRCSLVVNDGDGPQERMVRKPRRYDDRAIPVASVVRDEGEALIEKITDAGRKGVRLASTAHPSPAYLYDLVDYHRGGVPNDPSAKTDPGDLARIDIEFAPPPGQACPPRCASTSRRTSAAAARPFPFRQGSPGSAYRLGLRWRRHQVEAVRRASTAGRGRTRTDRLPAGQRPEGPVVRPHHAATPAQPTTSRSAVRAGSAPTSRRSATRVPPQRRCQHAADGLALPGRQAGQSARRLAGGRRR